MESRLAGNIRDYRRAMGLTQDQLAERLGITLGTVSKWERGSSEPDIGYIMELAGLFRVSVDALIGFSMDGCDADEEADRLDGLLNRVPFGEIEAECGKALRRFPNHFRIVIRAASAYREIGTLQKKEAGVRRALELYRHALGLISQNRDPEINEVVIRNEIAGCYCELKDYKRAVEEYTKNNLSGSNNARIGLVLIQSERKPEEGIPYTEKALLSQLSDFVTAMCGYIRYFLETGDTARGIRAAEWAIDHLTKAKEDPDRRAFTDKVISLFWLMLAVLRERAGEAERAEEDLRTAVRLARAFDADPVYTLENLAFMDHIPKSVYVYDDSGPTALEGLRATLEEARGLVPEAFRAKLEAEIAGRPPEEGELRLEEAGLTDGLLRELIRLSEDWEREGSCYGYRKNERADIEGSRIFLARVGDAVAGYLFGHVEKAERAASIMPDGTPFFEIEELYVCPAWRRRGIGQRLFDAAEQAVRGEAEYLMLSTAAKDWRAILHFYIDEMDMRFWSARLFRRCGGWTGPAEA